jgi:hypothetical protein
VETALSDGSKVCTGSIDATENYWGCPEGPGDDACTTTSGSDIRFTPWLKNPMASDADNGHGR